MSSGRKCSDRKTRQAVRSRRQTTLEADADDVYQTRGFLLGFLLLHLSFDRHKIIDY
jgi:hypothetical protein